MNSYSEQEQLAKLIGGQKFDMSDSGNMIIESLKRSLGEITPEYLSKINAEENPEGSSQDVSRNEYKPISKGINHEKLLTSLFSLYDSMIETFKFVDINDPLSEQITSNIWLVEKCIDDAGGAVDHFVPEDYVSGLEIPNMRSNALKVVETTKSCYKLGKITDETVSENGDTILISFNGLHNDIIYKAIGRITASNGWIGNEAIDYVYKPNGGKMSVKSFSDGRWINCGDNYDIQWELEEANVNDSNLDEQNAPSPTSTEPTMIDETEELIESKDKAEDDLENFDIITKNL